MEVSFLFLSTPPSRVATFAQAPAVSAADVSIHATLAGGDLATALNPSKTPLFLSTPPSRVATCWTDAYWRAIKCFYPRHPRGWRLLTRVGVGDLYDVSIHATLAGGDAGRCGLQTC